eukprot:CAMPEP_0195010886 /NCGR_PEP_ID=MMETSP0326_2-20130528/10501_1 /TAXON_ID=2866 ORGANISM="Crypthecodinium cohnii, Strain Seligo" /NCGR_SAMPLE_ID=MMETSP0326_2 /ASSEMBLY_ACC=CAM_ASM_000348 /LENGTH=77 /DNA_ID=CAMNT_0040019751 /DNA_START=68 /DNA_END=302 /DNA_ORIENTATION=-
MAIAKMHRRGRAAPGNPHAVGAKAADHGVHRKQEARTSVDFAPQPEGAEKQWGSERYEEFAEKEGLRTYEAVDCQMD